MLVQLILAFIIIAIIQQLFKGLNQIIDSPVVEVEQSDFESKYKDLPNLWYSNGITISSEKGLIAPPIAKECIDSDLFMVFHYKEHIDCMIIDTMNDNAITISIDYTELQQHSKEAVIQYLFDRKIII